MNRRSFLRKSFVLSAGGIFVPRLCLAPPNLAFMGKGAAKSSLNDVAAYWKMDDVGSGTRVDSVGSTNLTDVNSNVGQNASVTPALVSCAGRTLATTCALEHADSAIVGAGSGVSFTFSAWFNFNSFPVSVPLISKHNGSTTFDYILITNNPATTIGWFTLDAGTDNSGISLAVPSTGAWHHYVCGYDSPNQKLFFTIDNAALTTITKGDCRRTGSLPLDFLNFASPSQTQSLGGGAVDEVALFKRALTTGEITTLFNSGTPYALSNFFP